MEDAGLPLLSVEGVFFSRFSLSSLRFVLAFSLIRRRSLTLEETVNNVDATIASVSSEFRELLILISDTKSPYSLRSSFLAICFGFEDITNSFPNLGLIFLKFK